MSEAHRETPNPPTDQTQLCQELERYGLDTDYWLPVLSDKLGVDKVKQLKYLDMRAFDVLNKLKRHDWEEKAIKDLLNFTGDTVNTYGETDKNRANLRTEKAVQLGNTVNSPDNPQKQMEIQRRREPLLSNPERLVKDENVSLADSHHLVSEPKKTVQDETNLPDHDVVENASGGLALRGVLLTRSLQDSLQPRKTILEASPDAKLKSTSYQKDVVTEVTSRSQYDSFEQSLGTLGVGASTEIKGSGWGFSGELGFEKAHSEHEEKRTESHESKAFFSRTMHSFLPKALCEFELKKLRLSTQALDALKKIEKISKGTSEHELVQQSCEEFFKTYGSHVNTGTVQFGGLYVWVAKYSSESSSIDQVTKDMVKDTLNGFVSLSYSGVACNISGKVRGDYIKENSNFSRKYKSSEISKIDLSTTTFGGHSETHSIQKWRLGLERSNKTWALIDRGKPFTSDFTGIWEVILNHKNEFIERFELAKLMRRAWEEMSGIAPCFSQERQEGVLHSINNMDELVHKVSDWVNDTEFSSHCLNYLKQLEEEVRKCATPTYWKHLLKNERVLSEFFVKMAENKDKFDSVDLPNVRFLLRKLLEPVQSIECPDKERLMRLIGEERSICHPSAMSERVIKDVASLHEALKNTLLPEVQFKYAQLTEPYESTLQDIDIATTVETARVISAVLKSLQDSGDIYQIIFLTSTIDDYDNKESCFKGIVSKKGLEKLIHDLGEKWQEYTRYSSDLEQQAFLIHLILMKLPFENQQNVFSERIDPLNVRLHSQIKEVLATHARTSFDKEELESAMKQFMDGGNVVVQKQNLRIDDLANISPLEMNGNHELERIPLQTEVGLLEVELLDMLGLKQFHPSKLTLKHVMSVEFGNDTGTYKIDELPMVMLKKLIMIDFRGRDESISKSETATDAATIEDIHDIHGLLAELDEPSKNVMPPNPLDIFVVAFNCCDLMLRQVLLEKLFMCKLSIPLIFPRLERKHLEFSLWAARTIAVEWRCRDKEASQTSVTIQPFQIVSCIKIGQPFLSKSKLLNDVINGSAHNTFFNRDCPLGSLEKTVSSGMIEGAWFLPSGNKDEIFPDVTFMLNLRGDAAKAEESVNILLDMSSVTCVILNVENLREEKSLSLLKTIHRKVKKVMILLTSKEPSLETGILKQALQEYEAFVENPNVKDTKLILAFQRGKRKNATELKQELRKCIVDALVGETGRSLESCAVVARERKISIDEDDPNCQRGRLLAEGVICNRTIQDCKPMLRLQGELWLEWSNLLRRKHRPRLKSARSTTMEQVQKLDKEMKKLRSKQFEIANNLTPIMKTFVEALVSTVGKDDIATFFLEWLKFQFDEMSRKCLPELSREYHQKWQDLKKAQARPDKDRKVNEELARMVNQAEKDLAGQSLGLEHLFREIGQLYESIKESGITVDDTTKEKVELLPSIVANLLMLGHPMEIMDGDASNIPITWVKAVMKSIQEKVGDKRVFILSVLGVQSSGKSTLLNTMFGLKFAVSAGRCTRGVFMQFVEAEKTSGAPFDYVLVIDTEGLRAPELGLSKYDHDNELATLAIGLGDAAIMNIKGENTSEIRDVLQIAVHAFLRMKIVNRNIKLNQTCIFIHQNVPAVNAAEKMRYGCQKLQETLDEMAIEAAEQEDITDVSSFSQVIDFDGQKHVWYFSDLWHGDPPMAPANPGYSEKTQAVKMFLVNTFASKRKSYLSISDVSLRIEDLWNGILADDFVFSFRNSLEVKAYNSLEATFFNLEWELEKFVSDWLRKPAEIEIARCDSYDDVCKRYTDLTLKLAEVVSSKAEDIRVKLVEFFDKSSQKEILIQWQQNKLNALNCSRDEWIGTATSEIRQMKENKRLDLLQRKKDEGYKEEVIRKAKEYAESIKGQTASEAELVQKFGTMWIRWKNELAPMEPKEATPISTTVESILRTRLPRDGNILKAELEVCPLSSIVNKDKVEGSFSANRIKEHHLSIDKSWKESVKSLFGFGDSTISHKVLDVINGILHQVDIYMKNLTCQDRKFQSTNATEIIDMVIQGFNNHNSNRQKRRFTILPNLKVKVLAHVSRFTVGKFEKMQQDYERKHGYRAKLEQFKETTWTLFKNMVDQSTEEVTAADLFCSRLKTIILEMAAKPIPGEMVDQMVRTFSCTKHQMIVSILDDLTLGPFHHWKAYINNSKSYAMEWITTQMNNTFFTQRSSDSGSTRYAELAKCHIQTMVSRVRRGVEAATRGVEGTSHMHHWMDIFNDEVKDELVINKDSLTLITERKVEDISNFQRLVLEELSKVEKWILTYFQDQTASTVKWGGKTPFEQVLEKLWGCSAQCPFCHEPCQWTDPNHVHPGKDKNSKTHTCVQHRPSGVGGDRWDEDYRKDHLVLEHCNFQVGQDNINFNCRDCDFQCRNSEHCNTIGDDWQYHRQIEYHKYLPDWDIAPNNDIDRVKFWHWFMCKFGNQLKDMYGAKLPELPETWKSISVDEAKRSLRMKIG